MTMRGEGTVVWRDTRNDLKTQRIAILPNVGHGFCDLPDQRDDSGTDLTHACRRITRVEFDNQRAAGVDRAGAKGEYRVRPPTRLDKVRKEMQFR